MRISRSRSLAWLAPLAVAGAVAGGTVVATAGPSTAAPTLPSMSAHRLVSQVLAHAAHPRPLIGTVRESAALGLPSLPGDASTASLSWQSLLTGSHDVQVWVDGAARQRIAVLGQLSEADVVHRGTHLWTYTSATNTATATVLRHARAADAHSVTERFTPGGVAGALLKAVTPSTHVSVAAPRRVAGHPAYSLVLKPRDPRSTVRRVVVSVDATTFVPLRAQIFGSAAAPAFSIGFTRVDFATPSASVFNFHVPAGARLGKTPMSGQEVLPGRSAHRPRLSGSTRVLGAGWTSVLEMRGAGGAARVLPTQLSTPIPGSSNRLIQTALVNAVLRPDGTVFVGAVRPAMVERLAATVR